MPITTFYDNLNPKLVVHCMKKHMLTLHAWFLSTLICATVWIFSEGSRERSSFSPYCSYFVSFFLLASSLLWFLPLCHHIFPLSPVSCLPAPLIPPPYLDCYQLGNWQPLLLSWCKAVTSSLSPRPGCSLLWELCMVGKLHRPSVATQEDSGPPEQGLSPLGPGSTMEDARCCPVNGWTFSWKLPCARKLAQEGCCFPAAKTRDLTRSLLRLIRPKDYDPFLHMRTMLSEPEHLGVCDFCSITRLPMKLPCKTLLHAIRFASSDPKLPDPGCPLASEPELLRFLTNLFLIYLQLYT